MPFYYTPYTLLPLLSAFVNAGLAAYAWRRRAIPSAAPLFGVMVSLAGWSLCYAVNTSASELWLKILCFRLGTAFAIALVPAVIALGFEAAGLSFRPARSKLLLVTLPVLLPFLFSLTGVMPELFRHGFHLVRGDGLLLLGNTDGPLFRLYILYVLPANTALIILCEAGGLRREDVVYRTRHEGDAYVTS